MSKIHLPTPNQKEAVILLLTVLLLVILFIFNVLQFVPAILKVYKNDAATAQKPPIDVEVVNEAIEIINSR
jgi:hypothetical protein